MVSIQGTLLLVCTFWPLLCFQFQFFCPSLRFAISKQVSYNYGWFVYCIDFHSSVHASACGSSVVSLPLVLCICHYGLTSTAWPQRPLVNPGAAEARAAWRAMVNHLQMPKSQNASNAVSFITWHLNWQSRIQKERHADMPRPMLDEAYADAPLVKRRSASSRSGTPSSSLRPVTGNMLGEPPVAPLEHWGIGSRHNRNNSSSWVKNTLAPNSWGASGNLRSMNNLSYGRSVVTCTSISIVVTTQPQATLFRLSLPRSSLMEKERPRTVCITFVSNIRRIKL